MIVKRFFALIFAAPCISFAQSYIESFGIAEVNSAGGVVPVMSVTNANPRSAIKYVRVQVGMYNAVGDQVYSSIHGQTPRWVRMTGPLAPGDSRLAVRFEPIGYNQTTTCIRANTVEIEFMDGTTRTFSGKDVQKAMASGVYSDCSYASTQAAPKEWPAPPAILSPTQ